MAVKVKRTTINVRKRSQIKDYFTSFRKEHKLKNVGSGAFAKVYSKEFSKFIYKIGYAEHCDEGGNPFKWDAYLNYLERVVLKNQGNPFVPRVYSVEYITFVGPRITECYYIVKMERLQRYTCYTGIVREDALWRVGFVNIYDIEDDNDFERAARHDQTKALRSLVKPLRKLFNDFCQDIHTGNVMWRKPVKKGVLPQLVITDPIC